MNHRLIIPGIILLISFFLVPISSASIFVSPAEMWINLENDSDCTTGKTITVKNTYDYNVSVKAWMLHPDIIEWMRPNKTLIYNISWVSIEPSYIIIPSGSQAQFYVTVCIPDEYKNQTLDRNWETRAALQIDAVSTNQSTLIKEGYLVRVYIDTPPTPTPSEDESFFSTFILVSLFILCVAIIIVFVLYSLRRKKTE